MLLCSLPCQRSNQPSSRQGYQGYQRLKQIITTRSSHISNMSCAFISCSPSQAILNGLALSRPTMPRLFHSSASASTWGGGKLKSHSGTRKRFSPVSKARSRSTVAPIYPLSYSSVASEETLVNRAGESRGGPLFKRGKAGKRHLNLMTSGSKLNSLGASKVVGTGRLGVHLRRLFGGSV